MKKIFSRIWLPALVVVMLTLGTSIVLGARSVFGRNPFVLTPIGTDSAADFNPKVINYTVFGPGAAATINYLDLSGKPQRAPNAILPWTLTLTTTAPSASPNLVAQSDGQSITCRITVDGITKDERTATGLNAQTFCLVKSA